ncbi:iron-sulfur cluster-binding protein [Haladaptatus litoreus]|uniref:Iron-sulfur cluster-binding protein n=1 Tax=Haladaptatus litoreus TaxID=553468 RepID=A0A1N7E189_9EURY|nr:LUD domain-containing protein [Haladaptatus litoreus]SIR81830.1 iron-sulfur cluster-binding protein [Haladaptatus litoreus]
MTGKADNIRNLLATEGRNVETNTRTFNNGRYESTAELEQYEELKSKARTIKEDAIERLPELVETVRKSVEANGGTVYLADDAEDANRYVAEVANDADAELLVKSKTMTGEEIEVNDHLAESGIDVYETDLGEFVLQVADEAPSHLVAPAIHRSREDIARLFNGHFDPDEPLKTAEDLTAFASDYLGERIRNADVGLTGANFVAAETGTLALVTSEGNARKTASAPDTHIAVAGVEKLVPTIGDLQPFVELIGRSATGQDITSYVSFLTPPVETMTDSDENREFHLVLLDNGRMAMRDDDVLRETLYCVRCGACANSCANFQHVGGHAFGGETYTGGIATGWEAGVHGLDSASEFNDLCTGCSRCVNACPVEIDIPWINTAIRDRVNREGGGNLDSVYHGLLPDDEPASLNRGKRLFGNFSTLAKLGSRFAPVSNWVAGSTATRQFLSWAFGIDPRRELPEFQRETLVEWFAAREPLHTNEESTSKLAEREAILYPDPYTNYILVERGKAAVRVLESLGVSVRIPTLPPTGRAPLSQGMVETARSNARALSDELAPHLDSNRDVVVIEPSDLAMFRRDYEKLLPAPDFDRLDENSYELFEYIYGLLENGANPDALSPSASESDAEGEAEEQVTYHPHCQARTLGLEPYTVAVLSRFGYEIETTDVECCGMAGSFGYKSDYYDLSIAVGESAVENTTTECVVASGASCVEQFGALSKLSPNHPVQLLTCGIE